MSGLSLLGEAWPTRPTRLSRPCSWSIVSGTILLREKEIHGVKREMSEIIIHMYFKRVSLNLLLIVTHQQLLAVPGDSSAELHRCMQ